MTGLESCSDVVTPSPQRIRKQAARILSTPDFADFPRSSALLTYILEETLAGRAGELKEAVIGVEVFGREPGYDAKSDSVVRTQARRVREKLAQYYSSATAADSIEICVPKGAYIPEFRVRHDPERPRPRRFPYRLQLLCVAAALSLVVAGLLVARRAQSVRENRLTAISVFPFTYSSQRFGALGAGLAEDLERDLAHVNGLRIHVRPPVDQLTKAELSDYITLGRKLNVDALLEGQIAPSEIRVSLIRASDASIMWTDHFPADEDAGTVERRIEANVAAALHLKLSAAVLTQSENPKAHDLYFAGRALWATRNPEKTKEAIALFQQALKLDPNYALAWSGIADAYALMTVHAQIDSKIGMERGEEAARKAIALNPALAEAHAALGLALATRWEWKESAVENQRAIELNPSYDRAYARAGAIRFTFGDFPAAERLIRESERLNPYEMSLPMMRAELYYYWRRYDESEALIRDVQKVSPRYVNTFQLLARDLFEQHRAEEALKNARIAAGEYPDELLYQAELVPYLKACGQAQEAEQLLNYVQHPKTGEPADAYLLAIIYGRMGDRENALRSLEKAYADHVADLPSLRWEPALDLVRDDPRYKAIVAKIFPQGSTEPAKILPQRLYPLN